MGRRDGGDFGTASLKVVLELVLNVLVLLCVGPVSIKGVLNSMALAVCKYARRLK